jgi:hypothetical protein
MTPSFSVGAALREGGRPSSRAVARKVRASRSQIHFCDSGFLSVAIVTAQVFIAKCAIRIGVQRCAARLLLRRRVWSSKDPRSFAGHQARPEVRQRRYFRCRVRYGTINASDLVLLLGVHDETKSKPEGPSRLQPVRVKTRSTLPPRFGGNKLSLVPTPALRGENRCFDAPAGLWQPVRVEVLAARNASSARAGAQQYPDEREPAANVAPTMDWA